MTIAGRPKNSDSTPFLLICLLAFTALVFSNTLQNDFIDNWDDGGYILHNDLIQHLTWNNIKKMFTSYYQSNYHPLTLLSYALEYQWLGSTPFHFHFINYLLHLANVTAVYLLIRRLSGKPWTALLTAAFFAIHPLHVESVAWIAERKDVLYTFFFLLSLLSYAAHLKKSSSTSLYWCYLWFALSLLSKPAAICLPFVLVLMDYYHGQKLNAQKLLSKVPLFATAGAFGAIALSAQSSGAIQNIAPLYSWTDRIFLISYALAFYIVKAILPSGLCALHYYPLKHNNLLPLVYYLSFPFLLFIAIGIARSRIFKRELIFGFLFYLITIGLVIQVVPFGRAIVAERYTYVPYIGLFFILGQLYTYMVEKK